VQVVVRVAVQVTLQMVVVDLEPYLISGSRLFVALLLPPVQPEVLQNYPYCYEVLCGAKVQAMLKAILIVNDTAVNVDEPRKKINGDEC